MLVQWIKYHLYNHLFNLLSKYCNPTHPCILHTQEEGMQFKYCAQNMWFLSENKVSVLQRKLKNAASDVTVFMFKCDTYITAVHTSYILLGASFVHFIYVLKISINLKFLLSLLALVILELNLRRVVSLALWLIFQHF